MHAGEGGRDSCLFMLDLVAAYLKYAKRLGFQAEILNETDSSISVKLDGKGVMEAFEKESGKHCVQRVPPTESKGRRHTSMISVSIMPFSENKPIVMDLRDVDITTQRGHGAGGQHQNKVSSAVRAVHVPTGLKVFINGRDQKDNKELALAILQERVASQAREKEDSARRSAKSAQLGGGDRSGKIRTYNFISGLAQDHRTGASTGNIKGFMKGELELLQ